MKHIFPLIFSLLLPASLLLAACNGSAAPQLEGGEWQLIEMNGKPLPAQILVTLNFQEGQAGGRAPCNQYGAGYQQDGSHLSFEQVISTLMYCEDVMEYETEYLAALEGIRSFKLENDRLHLLDESGASVLVFSQPQTPALEGSTWKVSLPGISLPAEGSEMTMSFSDEQVNGQAPCNSYFAGYTQVGSALTFSAAGSTKMFCAGEDVMDVETIFLASLEQVRSVAAQAGGLALLDEGGNVVLLLTP